MVIYRPEAVLDGDAPGPWGERVEIPYDTRDVLLYAVGIGSEDLRFVYEGHPEFAVFPTFPIRWGGAGAPVSTDAIPPSPGPLNIDAERYLEMIRPLPTKGTATVESRVIAIHPKGRGNAFVEGESVVRDSDGNECFKLVNGSFRRGVEELGDIERFEGRGQSYSTKVLPPKTDPDVVVSAKIASNQAHIYRLSGDYNPLHIDPESARFGGFDEPILHGLCTFGHCAQLLLGALCGGDPSRFSKIKVRFSSPVFLGDELVVKAWHDGEGRVVFNATVEDKIVVSNAYFEYAS